MSIPNWANITVLKSKMYLDLTTVDADRDAALILLGQMITDNMIATLSNSAVDTAAPPLLLQRACLKQCCYEYKQRATPGLSSVQYTDGSISKYELDEFLPDVKKMMSKYQSWILHEDTPAVVVEDDIIS